VQRGAAVVVGGAGFDAAGAVPQPADRWGGTPLTDAETGGHTQVAKLLTQAADKNEVAV